MVEFQEDFLQIQQEYRQLLSDLKVVKGSGWEPEVVEVEKLQMVAPFVDYPTALYY